MRRLLVLCTMSLLVGIPSLVSAQHNQHSSKSAKLAPDGWPETRAGELGRGWVTAFSTGEQAMKEFNERELSKEGQAKRSLKVRVESYRKLRDQYGKLTLGSIVKSTPAELTVSLLDSDAKSHVFIFKVQTEPPYKLISVGMRQGGHGMHGMFGH